jgi:hypothetical protein
MASRPGIRQDPISGCRISDRGPAYPTAHACPAPPPGLTRSRVPAVAARASSPVRVRPARVRPARVLQVCVRSARVSPARVRPARVRLVRPGGCPARVLSFLRLAQLVRSSLVILESLRPSFPFPRGARRYGYHRRGRAGSRLAGAQLRASVQRYRRCAADTDGARPESEYLPGNPSRGRDSSCP